MLPTTILVDDMPRCVVRPNDTKDLNRFLRNGRAYLSRRTPTVISPTAMPTRSR